ncbi:periphilin-1 isoform X2 [Pseudorasbora parva]|uniref:periphilin-1 isoform X2 n=1 Tax=Pseudorasbora parva TaxID=51549 RepID=UPI00351E8D4F
MTYKELGIRQIYERYTGTAVPYRRVRVVAKRPDGGFTHTHSRERAQDTLLYHREALYFCNKLREDRLAGAQAHLRSGGAVSSQPGVRGQRLPRRPEEDAVLQAIMDLEREADGEGSRCRKHSRSRSRSARVNKQQNMSPGPPSIRLGGQEQHQPSGGPKEESPHTPVSASKIFFSDLDEIPGLGGDPEEPTLEEQCAQTIKNKAREIEKLYKQDCETLGMVVKMLISKDPTLELKLLTALKNSLVDIRERCLENLNQFISEVNVLLKPQSIT